jgi:hypothetical protein
MGLGRKQLDLETGKNSWPHAAKIDCHPLMIVQDLKLLGSIPILIRTSDDFPKEERKPRLFFELSDAEASIVNH